MSTATRTQWFSGDTKPAMYGVYERAFDFGFKEESVVFCKFAGMWFCSSLTPKGAIECMQISPIQSLDWRGLAENPDK